MITKIERNESVIKLHNEGQTVRYISDTVGISKSAVHKIITAHLEAIEVDIAVVVPSGTVKAEAGKVFDSFVGWLRISPNQYSHKDTGEIINVKFVPSAITVGCGHFITV